MLSPVNGVLVSFLTWKVLVAKFHVFQTEAVLGISRPGDLHAVLRSVGSRTGRHESLEILQRQAERPLRRSVRPRVVHLPEAVLARTGPYRLDFDRARQAEGVSRHLAMDAARIVVEMADQCRQSVGGTGPRVHGCDGAARLRIVVRHDDVDLSAAAAAAAAAAGESETETGKQRTTSTMRRGFAPRHAREMI